MMIKTTANYTQATLLHKYLFFFIIFNILNLYCFDFLAINWREITWFQYAALNDNVVTKTVLGQQINNGEKYLSRKEYVYARLDCKYNFSPYSFLERDFLHY